MLANWARLAQIVVMNRARMCFGVSIFLSTVIQSNLQWPMGVAVAELHGHHVILENLSYNAIAEATIAKKPHSIFAIGSINCISSAPQ